MRRGSHGLRLPTVWRFSFLPNSTCRSKVCKRGPRCTPTCRVPRLGMCCTLCGGQLGLSLLPVCDVCPTCRSYSRYRSASRGFCFTVSVVSFRSSTGRGRWFWVIGRRRFRISVLRSACACTLRPTWDHMFKGRTDRRLGGH